MILKNWLSNTRIGCLFVVRGMDDFFTIKEDLFDDYEDELEELVFLRLHYHVFVFIFLKATPNIVLKSM